LFGARLSRQYPKLGIELFAEKPGKGLKPVQGCIIEGSPVGNPPQVLNLGKFVCSGGPRPIGIEATKRVVPGVNRSETKEFLWGGWVAGKKDRGWDWKGR